MSNGGIGPNMFIIINKRKRDRNIASYLHGKHHATLSESFETCLLTSTMYLDNALGFSRGEIELHGITGKNIVAYTSNTN